MLQLGRLPLAPQLIAAWGVFWLGIFRYWLRDLQLDDAVLEPVLTENYLWTIPVLVFAAHLVMALCLMELFGGAPALLLASVGLDAKGIAAAIRERVGVAEPRLVVNNG